MNSQKVWKFGIFTFFLLGLCACSTPTVSEDDDYSSPKEVSQMSSSEIKTLTKNSSSSNQSSSISSSSSDSSTTNVICTDNESHTKVCFDVVDPNPNPVQIDRPTIFEAPSVSAVIFMWDTTDTDNIEFSLVVDGNYLTHAIIEADNMDSLVYEFRWNDEDSTHWDRIKISNSKPIKYINDSQRTFTLKELCHSYASARIIWTDKKDKTQFRTEWSDPVGPLYTLTVNTDARTKFAYPFEGKNPCE